MPSSFLCSLHIEQQRDVFSPIMERFVYVLSVWASIQKVLIVCISLILSVSLWCVFYMRRFSLVKSRTF